MTTNSGSSSGDVHAATRLLVADTAVKNDGVGIISGGDDCGPTPTAPNSVGNNGNGDTITAPNNKKRKPLRKRLLKKEKGSGLKHEIQLSLFYQITLHRITILLHNRQTTTTMKLLSLLLLSAAAVTKHLIRRCLFLSSEHCSVSTAAIVRQQCYIIFGCRYSFSCRGSIVVQQQW